MKLSPFLKQALIGLILGDQREFSTLNSKSFRLTKLEQKKFFISPELKEILIGVSLGDLHIDKKSPTRNALLRFEQGSIHEDYLLHLYDLFKIYCRSGPQYSDRKADFRTNKIYSRIQFQTRSLPCFNEFHELFYPDGVKIIPSNISEYLTEVSLAFWIMDDGGKTTYGDLLLHTNSYTLEEVELLVSVLNQKFHLVCKVSQRRPNQWAILIPKRELHKVRALVSIYIHSSMEYKISE
jgi:hypothetical protein